MISWFLDTPGRLYVLATLLPLGVFVLLAFDRFLHFPSQANDITLAIGVLDTCFGSLADMFFFAMDVNQQRFQFFFEKHVIVRATEASLVPEFVKSDAANGASLLV